VEEVAVAERVAGASDRDKSEILIWTAYQASAANYPPRFFGVDMLPRNCRDPR